MLVARSPSSDLSIPNINDPSRLPSALVSGNAEKEPLLDSDVAGAPPAAGTSYLRWTDRQRRNILLLVAFPSMLGPLCTTIYLPSLHQVSVDLETSTTNVSLTISSFNLIFGFMPLVWGPLSDRYSRKWVLAAALAMIVVFSAVCALAWNIWALVAFRALQALGASALYVSCTGMLSDVFPPQGRGRALGLIAIPSLLMPLVGPIIGGLLSALFDWRAVFVAVAATATLPLLTTVFMLPETLDQELAASEDRSLNPLRPLLYLLHWPIGVLCVVNSLSFSFMYLVLTVFPIALSATYGLSVLYVGLLMVPFGVGTLVGTFVGGRSADFGAVLKGKGGRLIAPVTGSIAIAGSLLLFAGSLATHVVLLVVSTTIVGFFMIFSRPGLLTYCIQERPKNSSGVTAALLVVQSLVAVGIVTFGSWLAQRSMPEVVALFCAGFVALILTTIPAAVIMVKNIGSPLSRTAVGIN